MVSREITLAFIVRYLRYFSKSLFSSDAISVARAPVNVCSDSFPWIRNRKLIIYMYATVKYRGACSVTNDRSILKHYKMRNSTIPLSFPDPN